ncbi:hypothetical protein CDD82_6306 [Ophiocordyceps australis]|uniref:Uncharacterized protein n=1 Tax=Ophiocordyceps australis TaxID=1399860 RepID=A0A2C5ZR59_9HYPO|nr:hypothetical protein CDD82_6306 [Ophiocordyceps australis]
MTSCGKPFVLSCRLVVWAWLCLWLQPSTLVSVFAVGDIFTDHPPRAVLVALAHEHDLQPILSSITQIQDIFNTRYRYDWVFFSTSPLSDGFRRLTSNATNATCLYEVVDLQDSLHTVDGPSGAASLPSLVGQARRWKCGPFANEMRLCDYDWFWRIEPGAQFVDDLDFDVFRVMRDHGCAYGSNKGELEDEPTDGLWRHVEKFIKENPGLLHAEADISWLLGALHGTGQALAQHGNLVSQEMDGLLCNGQHDVDEDSPSPAEALAAWLGSIYKSSKSATVEIGSLAFLRSQSHQALVEHLDKAGGLYSGAMGDASTPTLSATMFLPQKSVVLRLGKERRYIRGSVARPDPTPKPKLKMGGNVRFLDTTGNDAAGLPCGGAHEQLMEAMSWWFGTWELVARDFARQDGIPGLRSGNTVIDERNFTLEPKSKQME